MIKVALDAIVQNPHIEVVVLAAAVKVLFRLTSASNIDELPNSENQPTVIEGMDKVVSRIVASNKKVVLTIDNPILPDPKDCIGRKASLEILNWINQIETKNCVIRKFSIKMRQMDSLFKLRLTSSV